MFNYLIVHIDVANWELAVRTVRVAMEWAPLVIYCAVAVLSCPGAPLTPHEVCSIQTTECAVMEPARVNVAP